MNAAIVGWSAPTVSDGKSFVSLTISALSTLSSLSLATLAAVLQAPGPTFHWLLSSHKERIWDDPLRTQQLASVSAGFGLMRSVSFHVQLKHPLVAFAAVGEALPASEKERSFAADVPLPLADIEILPVFCHCP